MKFALIAALLAASPVLAQPPRESGPPEDRSPRPELFISPMGEPFRQGGPAAWFAGADTDGDGALSATEFETDGQRFFRTLDGDGDGRLSGIELQTYETEVAPEITGLMDGGGLPRRGGRSGRQGAARFSHLNIPEPVSGADLDVDRAVSLAEWRRTMTIRFRDLDLAKAGQLTLTSLPALIRERPEGERGPRRGARRAARRPAGAPGRLGPAIWPFRRPPRGRSS